MGMSPQSGLPQNNRSGDVDPYALLHVSKTTGRSLEDLLVELSTRAGLAGMSGTSGDMRDLEAAAANGNEGREDSHRCLCEFDSPLAWRGHGRTWWP